MHVYEMMLFDDDIIILVDILLISTQFYKALVKVYTPLYFIRHNCILLTIPQSRYRLYFLQINA